MYPVEMSAGQGFVGFIVLATAITLIGTTVTTHTRLNKVEELGFVNQTALDEIQYQIDEIQHQINETQNMTTTLGLVVNGSATFGDGLVLLGGLN